MRGPAKGAGHGRPAPPRPYKPSQPCQRPGTGTGRVFSRVYFFSDEDPGFLCCRWEEQGGRREPGCHLLLRPGGPGWGWGWGWGSARPAPPRLPSPGHSCCVGLRLQRWNKTALLHYFFVCLFVHLNVYSELHFVKPFPALFIPQLTEVFTFQISRTRL